MTNILDTILLRKKQEVAERKAAAGVRELERRPAYGLAVPSLREFLLRKDRSGIIAEFKRRSPSRGIINDRADAAGTLLGYATHGASAVSVLTDEPFFGGTLEDLAAAPGSGIPVLRKDFMIDEYQLVESKAHGAAVILLIAACLSREEVKKMASFAKNIGLNVLLEIHGAHELDHICDTVDVVGVNNRDLKSFTVDISRSVELSNQIPGTLVKISESGLDDPGTIRLLREYGYNGFLIGEKFMKAPDPTIAFAQFVEQLNG